MKEKRNIHELIVKEAPSLNNLLDAEDVSKFRELTSELREIPGPRNKSLELKQK